MKELLASRHFRVRYDEPARIVHVARTHAPFATLDEIAPAFDEVTAAIAAIPRQATGIVVDTRGGPVRNDPEFEAIFAPCRKRLLAGFGRAAVLVRTAIGRLQAKRYIETDRMEVRIFDDEAAARAWARVP